MYFFIQNDDYNNSTITELLKAHMKLIEDHTKNLINGDEYIFESKTIFEKMQLLQN